MHLRRIRPADVAKYTAKECEQLRLALWAEKRKWNYNDPGTVPVYFLALVAALLERQTELWEQLPLF